MAENLLINPSFEGDYEEQGAPELKVAPGWVFGYEPWGKRPELLPSDWATVAGETAQKGFSTYDRTHWWLWQIVSVEKGEWYRGRASVYCWSSDHDDGNVSRPPDGKCWARVGIQPWGSLEPTSWSTAFGPALVSVYDRWQVYEVTAQAQRDHIVFMIDLKAEHKVKHNDWCVDCAELVHIGEPEEPPLPPEPPEPGAVDYDEIERRVLKVVRGVQLVLP